MSLLFPFQGVRGGLVPFPGGARPADLALWTAQGLSGGHLGGPPAVLAGGAGADRLRRRPGRALTLLAGVAFGPAAGALGRPRPAPTRAAGAWLAAERPTGGAADGRRPPRPVVRHRAQRGRRPRPTVRRPCSPPRRPTAWTTSCCSPTGRTYLAPVYDGLATVLPASSTLADAGALRIYRVAGSPAPAGTGRAGGAGADPTRRLAPDAGSAASSPAAVSAQAGVTPVAGRAPPAGRGRSPAGAAAGWGSSIRPSAVHQVAVGQDVHVHHAGPPAPRSAPAPPRLDALDQAQQRRAGEPPSAPRPPDSGTGPWSRSPQGGVS